MEAVEHLLLFLWQIGHNAMQEQCRLIEQPFGRLDAFYNHAARQRMQAGIFFGRQFLAREYDDRQIADFRRVAHPLEDVEPGHVGQTEIENDAIEGFACYCVEGFLSRGGDSEIDVVVTQQFTNGELFRGVVFHDQ